MEAWFFWLALLGLLPSVYLTLRLIVWISEKLERKK
tara:strand:- start:445 stop:552 length:108 start_codon:yes stop_codon:yes gene_type:complete